MLTDEFCLEVLQSLSAADRFGLGLAELAAKVWPGSEPDPKRHGVLGQALSELGERGMVVCSGGRRARYAVSPEGENWLRRYRVTPGASPADLARSAAFVASPAPPPPGDPIAACIEAMLAPPAVALPPGTTNAEAYARGQALGRIKGRREEELLRAACGGDDATFQLALAEVSRRRRARIAEIEDMLAAAGVEDPGNPWGGAAAY